MVGFLLIINSLDRYHDAYYTMLGERGVVVRPVAAKLPDTLRKSYQGGGMRWGEVGAQVCAQRCPHHAFGCCQLGA
jgi:hypothetical protein